MLYILKGYVKKETGCNIMQAYKTKAAAKKRFDKMIVCNERRRKHGTICTDTKKPEKDQTRNNRARMAIKAGDPGKRP